MAAKRDQRDKSFNYIFHEYTSSIVYREWTDRIKFSNTIYLNLYEQDIR